MAILTGDRYLDLLARFVEDHADGLLDGSLVLKLNPVGLYYVQTRLDALHELERLRAGAPVDYLRAFISDLGDHRALEQLSRVLNLLTSVKIVSVLRSPARDPSTVTVSPFGRLKSLELRGCDLSTSAARGLIQLRPILERLICHNSADALRHIFTEQILEVKDSPVWSRLAFVSCAFNGMIFMDDSLQLLPAVQFLDLSRNRFAKAGNLHRCAKLKFVDLGFNHLRNISSLRQIKSQITKLVLKNNSLASVKGIASLTSLEALDLSNNLISKFKEIQFVARIPSLHTILLEGNPVSASVFYREEVFSLFQDPGKVLLDGRKILKSEYWTVSRIKAKRLKQEALYGAYAPAITADIQPGTLPIELTDPGSDAGTSNSRRKISRLALIHDAQTLLKEVTEQDESQEFYPLNDLSRDLRERRQDSLEDGSIGKSEAINLMQKVEALKEEGPKSWIQELRVLLNDSAGSSEQVQQSATLEDESASVTSDSGIKNLRRLQSRRRRRCQRRSFVEGLDANEDQYLKGSLEKGSSSSFSNDFAVHSQFAEVNDKDSASLYDDDNLSGLNSAASSPRGIAPTKPTSDQDDSLVPSVEGEVQSEMGNVDETMQVGSLITADEEQTSLDETFGSWRLLNEVIDSRGTGGGLESPPHYNEDVLQKRQDLEEELLRISLDSGCAASSSETESSSDESLIMISGSSRSDGSSPRGMTDFRRGSPKSRNWERWQGSAYVQGTVEKNSTEHGGEQSTSSGPNKEEMMEPSGDQHYLTSSTGKENTSEASGSGHASPSCTDDIRANAGGGEEHESDEKALSKPRVRRKLRKARTVKLYKEDELDESSCVAPNTQSAELNAAAKLSQMNLEIPECITASSSGSRLLSSPALVQKAEKRVESAKGGDSALRTPRNGTCGSSADLEDCVEKYFRQKIANEGESCSKQVRCGCIRLWEEIPSERDVHILLSNKDRLYIIAESSSRKGKLSSSGSDSDLHVLASHKLRDVKKIMVGLGLQALRVDIGHGASYLMVARDINISREILEMLRNTDNSGPAPEFESWEHKQINMFEELVLGGTRTSVLMYLMPLFSHGTSLETMWTARSVFLTSHHIFVCIEDLVRFGAASSEESMTANPYFIMEAAADIYDLLEVVAGFTDDCVTLHFKKTVSGGSTSMKYDKEVPTDQQATVWRFKGVLGDAASKLVALLHASHIDFALALPDCQQS